MPATIRLFEPAEPQRKRRHWLPNPLSPSEEATCVQFARDQIEREMRGRGNGPCVQKIRAAERDLFIFEFLLGTGLRSEEFRDLQTHHISLTDRTVYVDHGKGDKARYVPFADVLAPVIAAWIGHRTGFVVTGDDGLELAESTLYWRVRRLGARAGIARIVHPHTLRHTFATRIYEATRDLLVVQKLLGHDSVATTQIYAACAPEILREAVNKRSRV